MVEYDPSVIQKFAGAMYKKARYTIVSYTLLGIIVGAGLGFVLPSFGPDSLHTEMWSQVFAVFGAFIFGAAAHNQAQMKVFHLKLEAQTALCQMAIEANTRLRTSAEPRGEVSRAAA